MVPPSCLIRTNGEGDEGETMTFRQESNEEEGEEETSNECDFIVYACEFFYVLYKFIYVNTTLCAQLFMVYFIEYL